MNTENKPTASTVRTNTLERGRLFFKRHWQLVFNIYLFLNFAGYTAWQAYHIWEGGYWDYAEAAFIIHNMVFVTVILIRRQHQAVDRHVWRQLVALVAFCSGIAFIGQPPSGGPVAHAVSRGVIFTANTLGVICLLNLGRSFGILIAYRSIKTTGLYAFVRHPMYGTDILLRIGFLIGHWNWLTIALFLGSTICYVYRAMLEEQFLRQQPEYQQYIQRVKYRFIPGIF